MSMFYLELLFFTKMFYVNIKVTIPLFPSCTINQVHLFAIFEMHLHSFVVAFAVLWHLEFISLLQMTHSHSNTIHWSLCSTCQVLTSRCLNNYIWLHRSYRLKLNMKLFTWLLNWSWMNIMHSWHYLINPMLCE